MLLMHSFFVVALFSFSSFFYTHSGSVTKLMSTAVSYDVDAIIPGLFMSFGQLARFLLRKARLLFAFLDVVSTCAFQVKLSAMVTPKYLPVLFTVRL